MILMATVSTPWHFASDDDEWAWVSRSPDLQADSGPRFRRLDLLVDRSITGWNQGRFDQRFIDGRQAQRTRQDCADELCGIPPPSPSEFASAAFLTSAKLQLDANRVPTSSHVCKLTVSKRSPGVEIEASRSVGGCISASAPMAARTTGEMTASGRMASR